MTLINLIKGILFYLTIIISALYMLVFAYTPAALLIFINQRIHFRLCSFIMGHYLLMITCLLEDLLDIRIVITGDELTKEKKRSIIVLNHRTRLDWMYIWMLYSRFELLDQLKITLKSELKRIPGIGWGSYHGGFLFLHRKWERDQDEMQKTVKYYKTSQSPVSLLIFPEGTNLSSIATLKSNNYASKQKLFNRSYDYCLHPHTTGFTYLLNTMRSNKIIDSVDDVTIGYEGNFPMTELDLLKGHFPKRVHFHVKRYQIDDIPNEDEQISLWLQKCWDEKEDRLKEFYTKNQFDSSSKQFHHQQTESNVKIQRRLTLILSIIIIIFCSYCFIVFRTVKFYVLIICIFQLIMEVYINWIQDLITQHHTKHQ